MAGVLGLAGLAAHSSFGLAWGGRCVSGLALRAGATWGAALWARCSCCWVPVGDVAVVRRGRWRGCLDRLGNRWPEVGAVAVRLGVRWVRWVRLVAGAASYTTSVAAGLVGGGALLWLCLDRLGNRWLGGWGVATGSAWRWLAHLGAWWWLSGWLGGGSGWPSGLSPRELRHGCMGKREQKAEGKTMEQVIEIWTTNSEHPCKRCRE